jgi:FAD:protein FMN transferase
MSEGQPKPNLALWVLLFTIILSIGVFLVPRMQFVDGAGLREFTGPTMGTGYTVKVLMGERAIEADAVSEVDAAIVSTLEDINQKMSSYLPESELSRFNRAPDGEPFPISPETLEVLRISSEVSAATDGAFDVTVGPLVDAWGFGPDGRPENPPTEDEIAELKKRVGFRLLHIDPDTLSVTKMHAEVSCKLGAVAKGYAVDRVALALEALGYTDYMIEVGGEVRTGGERPLGGPWLIGVQQPDAVLQSAYNALPLSNLSMATSGDYRNYYEQDGTRYSHTIDPRTGRPTAHSLASVSVIHRDCVVADAYATALMVLGPDEGHALAEREGLAAYFLVRDGAGFQPKTTAAFKALLEGN